MKKYKYAALLLIIFVTLFIIGQQFEDVRKATARLTAATYITLHYNNMDFKYQQTEFSPQFGSYFVFYKSKVGKNVAFEVSSKHMPLVITWDPLHPGA